MASRNVKVRHSLTTISNSERFLFVQKKEEKLTLPAHEAVGTGAPAQEQKFTWSRKLFLLSGLLWGGILLLAFEHLWHGEVTLFAPFLTAMSNPEDKAVMLHEMATVGVTMKIGRAHV